MDIAAMIPSDLGVEIAAFVVTVPPGFDVGAHVHAEGMELFYIIEGTLDLFAFTPVTFQGPWASWRSPTEATAVQAHAGDFMFVPPGCPHAFANPGPEPARMFFLTSTPGHESYFSELAQAVTSGADQDAIIRIRARYGIEQLTMPRIPKSKGHEDDE
ncbi:cupin domain-containing protein [Streptomyces chartreusis]|uniref:cupin domain-containing protein n=1 Tax=Streptomyces chartreusis TaxID=1969 RepID=UPI0033F714F2